MAIDSIGSCDYHVFSLLFCLIYVLREYYMISLFLVCKTNVIAIKLPLKENKNAVRIKQILFWLIIKFECFHGLSNTE